MEDTSCRRFSTDADSTNFHRQYEALRHIFVNGLRQDDVAGRFGYRHGGIRQPIHQFRDDRQRTGKRDQGLCPALIQRGQGRQGPIGSSRRSTPAASRLGRLIMGEYLLQVEAEWAEFRLVAVAMHCKTIKIPAVAWWVCTKNRDCFKCSRGSLQSQRMTSMPQSRALLSTNVFPPRS